jgi:hypothetical protein
MGDDAQPLPEAAEAALLAALARLSPRARRALLDALQRRSDGQPLEDAFVEFFMEFGYSPAEARREVEKMNSGGPNWRQALN